MILSKIVVCGGNENIEKCEARRVVDSGDLRPRYLAMIVTEAAWQIRTGNTGARPFGVIYRKAAIVKL
jgi:hypothetical protein